MTARDSSSDTGSDSGSNSGSGSGATIAVDRLTGFGGPDLHDLCDAAEAAILDGGGFGWLNPPPRQVLETYWRACCWCPSASFSSAASTARIAGSAQLVRPPRNNEAQA
jgi:hypothetical protein